MSDPSLAEPHKAGARVQRIQFAEHAQLGTITYEIRRLWPLHLAMARGGHVTLVRCHEQILRLPIRPSNERSLSADDRPDLALAVYVAGTQMIINVVLAMQHFCQEIEASLGVELAQRTLWERVKEAFALANLDTETGGPGYAALGEIVERRDAIEHPRQRNVHNSHANEWDQVPMSWLLTERAPKAFGIWDAWFAQVADKWAQHEVNQPRTITVTVKRGQKSVRSAKKPPRSDDRR